MVEGVTKMWIGGTAVLLALFVVVVWRNEGLTKKLNAANQRAWVAEQSLATERDNTRKANEAAKRHSDRADELEADRRDNPLPPVRVCKRPAASVPEAGAATVAGEAAQADDPRTDAGDSDSIDIGPALDDFATDAEKNLIQCEELIRWVGER